MSSTLKKILSNKKVDFGKLQKKVEKNIKKATKTVNKRTLNKIAKTARKVMKVLPFNEGLQLKEADKNIKQVHHDHSEVKERISKLMTTFKVLVEHIKKQKEKVTEAQKKQLKHTYAEVDKAIKGAVFKLNLLFKNLKAIKEKLESKKTKKIS